MLDIKVAEIPLNISFWKTLPLVMILYFEQLILWPAYIILMPGCMAIRSGLLVGHYFVQPSPPAQIFFQTLNHSVQNMA